MSTIPDLMYHDQKNVDYSLRVWQAGYSILFYPAFTMLHHTQQITHKKPLSRTSLSHFRGLLYYYWKHGGWLRKPEMKNGTIHAKTRRRKEELDNLMVLPSTIC